MELTLAEHPFWSLSQAACEGFLALLHHEIFLRPAEEQQT